MGPWGRVLLESVGWLWHQLDLVECMHQDTPLLASKTWMLPNGSYVSISKNNMARYSVVLCVVTLSNIRVVYIVSRLKRFGLMHWSTTGRYCHPWSPVHSMTGTKHKPYSLEIKRQIEIKIISHENFKMKIFFCEKHHISVPVPLNIVDFQLNWTTGNPFPLHYELIDSITCVPALQQFRLQQLWDNVSSRFYFFFSHGAQELEGYGRSVGSREGFSSRR